MNGLAATVGDLSEGEFNKYTSEELLSVLAAAGIPDVATRIGNELLWNLEGEEMDLVRAFGLNVRESE